jgi:hypothetical protein
MLDFRIKEILRVMDELTLVGKRHPLEKLDEKAAREGLEMSRTVSAQQEEVVTTPWMKNLLLAFGDLKRDKDGKSSRLTIEEAGKTKAEKFLSEVVKACLLKFNGKERTGYNQKLSVLDPDHYNVDCWLQNKFGDYMWDIKAGQAKQRAEFMAMYETTAHLTIPEVKKLLENDPIMQKACIVLLEVIPQVKADKVIHNISAPFMNKDSNTGYPFFRNDRKVVSSKDSVTWGRYTIDLAEKLTDQLNKPWQVWKYNVDVGWARNQRGKGRAIIAKSRLFNLVVNSLEANEVACMKQIPLFVGLNDDQTQKQQMILQAEFCEKHPEYKSANFDQDGYDHHIGEGFVCLIAALRKIKANGHLARELADLRFAGAQKSWCIDGANNKIKEIYGRTTSGYIDTMGQNSWLTVLLVLYCLMSLDTDYSTNVWHQVAQAIFSLGDDMCFIYKDDPEFNAKFSKVMATLGFDVKPEKYAYGEFFLQYRLYKKDGEYHMVYPWTRVLRSMLSKENKKGLGPVGWAISGWQQLSKLVENEDSLKIVLNLILPLDTEMLYLDKPISWIKEQIALEDREAKAKDKYARTTAQILYQGNPQQEKHYTKDGDSFSFDFLGDLQSKLKAAIVPNFYESIGFKTPKITS